MSETKTETPEINPTKKPSPVLASIKGELASRKWRAMIMQLGGALAVLIPNLDTVWGWIVAGAMWAVALGSYILGVGIEDSGAKRAAFGDTTINVGGSDKAATVRTKRTSLTPIVTGDGMIDRVDTVETEIAGG